jgi:hemerythrin superfamily protein
VRPVDGCGGLVTRIARHASAHPHPGSARASACDDGSGDPASRRSGLPLAQTRGNDLPGHGRGSKARPQIRTGRQGSFDPSTAKRNSMPTSKTAAKKPATASAAKTDATILLTRDHTEVKKLFKQYEKLVKAEADGSDRQALAEQICDMLTVHASIEEEIFYPAAREAEVDSDLLDEAEVEHASAKDLIAQIQAMGPDDELYDAKVTVLGEYIDHHVQEEEGEMFPKCRRAGMDLAELAAQLAERKSELMSETAS